MAKPVPDDRSALAAMDRIKQYNSYKAKQVKAMAEEQPPVEPSLETFETWAADTADDGKAWAQSKQAKAEKQIETSQKWDAKVEADNKAATEEAAARAQLDTGKLKEDMKKVLDQYQDALKKEADAGQDWAKQKLPQVTQEHAKAKKVIDQKLEKTFDSAADMNAAKRHKNKLIAQKMGKKSDEAKAWKNEYADQPAKQPAGQRADVKAALDQIGKWAGETINQIQSFGAKAGPHIESLRKVQQWAGGLGPQIDQASTPAAMKAAKASGAQGAAEARAVKAKVDQLQNQAESDVNDAKDVYGRWHEHYDGLAKQWIGSDSAKHREWAQQWMNMNK